MGQLDDKNGQTHLLAEGRKVDAHAGTSCTRAPVRHRSRSFAVGSFPATMHLNSVIPSPTEGATGVDTRRRRGKEIRRGGTPSISPLRSCSLLPPC
jgi:hypothetical protein